MKFTLTFLSLISVAFCAENVAKATENPVASPGNNQQLQTTPPRYYTREDQNGNTKSYSEMLVGPNELKTRKRSVYNDENSRVHYRSYSSAYAYKSDGISNDDIGNFARNLNPEFVKTVVNEEKRITG